MAGPILPVSWEQPMWAGVRLGKKEPPKCVPRRADAGDPVRDALEGKAQVAPPSRDSRASSPGAGGTLMAGEGAEEGQRGPAHRLLRWVRGSAHQEWDRAGNPSPPAEGTKHCALSPAVPAPNPIMTLEPCHDPRTHHDLELHHDPRTPSGPWNPVMTPQPHHHL